jgi:hypothetical protein
MSTQFGFDINNPGASVFARGAIEVAPAYFTAIVEDIIINEKNGKYLKYSRDGSNIGEAKVRIVPNDANAQLKDLKSAFPLDINIQEFPFVGEQVIVFPAAGTLFYTRKLSTKRKITDNISTTMQRHLAPSDATAVRDTRELSRRGVPTNSTRTSTSGNDLPRLNIDTRPVRSSPGDLIVQGRFGNAIRVGSNLFSDPTVRTPQPNILLTAGFWRTPTQLSTTQITPYSLAYENINKDRSSIWMVSDQNVSFEAATAKSTSKKKAHMVSSLINPGGPSEYNGAQIFINSDRVILNSKLNEISLFSNREINLSALKSITLDTESSILASSNQNVTIKADGDIYLKGKTITLKSDQDLSYKTDGNYTIIGKKIFIGRYADKTHPMVSGSELATWLQRLMDAFIVEIPKSIATLNPQPFIQEIGKLRLELGTPLKPAVFNSQDNFTAITNQ